MMPTELDVQAELRGDAVITDPYRFYDRLRTTAPVCPVPGTDIVLVSSWDLVSEAAGRVEDFSNQFRHTLYRGDDGDLGVFHHYPGGTPVDVFAGADPPQHTTHRKLFFPELVTAKMEALEPEVTRVADELLDGGETDLAVGLANLLPVRVVADLVVGFRDTDHAQLASWVHAGSRMMSGRLGMVEMAQAATEAAGLMPWVAEQLEAGLDRRTQGDVLSAAVQGVREGTLTRDEAVFTLMVLVGAGAETTTGLIGNAVRLLAERPELQSTLRQDPSLVPAYVEEVLRFESPFRFHPRTASHATQLGGVEIAEKSMVLLMWGAANRDPAVFDHPGDLELNRRNARRHVAFGRGIHHCVGAVLARLETRVVLTRLLERTRSFSLDPDRPPHWANNLWIRRNETLPLMLDPA